MLVREALKQYEPDPNNPFSAITNSIRLRKDLEALAKQQPVWKFFVHLVIMYSQGLLLPESVQQVCDILGIPEIEQLYNFINSIRGDAILDEFIDPHLSYQKVEKLGQNAIIDLVLAQASCEPDIKFDFGDLEYWLLSEDEVQLALRKCPIDRLKYVKDEHDCEDFARETKTWVSRHIGGTVAFAYTEVNFYKDGNIFMAHGINTAIVRSEEGPKVLCIEPQRDVKLWPCCEPEWGFHAEEMKIRFIQF